MTWCEIEGSSAWETGRRGGWLVLNQGVGRQGVCFRVSVPFFSIPELVLEVGVN